MELRYKSVNDIIPIKLCCLLASITLYTIIIVCYCYCCWFDRNYDRALQLMQRATAVPTKRAAYYDKVV